MFHCSQHDKIHIFKIERDESNGQILKKSILSTNVFGDRAFAWASTGEARKHCVIAKLEGQLSLLVACDDGFLYIYKLRENGGECSLEKVHDLRADLDFARIGGSESLEALALEESLKKKEEIEVETVNEVVEEENPIVKSSYADIIKKAGSSPSQDNQKKSKKNNKTFKIDHDNFKYEESCRV